MRPATSKVTVRSILESACILERVVGADCTRSGPAPTKTEVTLGPAAAESPRRRGSAAAKTRTVGRSGVTK